MPMFGPSAEIEASHLNNKQAGAASTFDERLLDHEVAGLAVVAFD